MAGRRDPTRGDTRRNCHLSVTWRGPVVGGIGLEWNFDSIFIRRLAPLLPPISVISKGIAFLAKLINCMCYRPSRNYTVCERSDRAQAVKVLGCVNPPIVCVLL